MTEKQYRVTCADGYVMDPWCTEEQVRQHLAWRLPNGQPADCSPHTIEVREVITTEWQPTNEFDQREGR